jgi:hypothetical protein
LTNRPGNKKRVDTVHARLIEGVKRVIKPRNHIVVGEYEFAVFGPEEPCGPARLFGLAKFGIGEGHRECVDSALCFARESRNCRRIDSPAEKYANWKIGYQVAGDGVLQKAPYFLCWRNSF